MVSLLGRLRTPNRPNQELLPLVSPPFSENLESPLCPFLEFLRVRCGAFPHAPLSVHTPQQPTAGDGLNEFPQLQVPLFALDLLLDITHDSSQEPPANAVQDPQSKQESTGSEYPGKNIERWHVHGLNLNQNSWANNSNWANHNNRARIDLTSEIRAVIRTSNHGHLG